MEKDNLLICEDSLYHWNKWYDSYTIEVNKLEQIQNDTINSLNFYIDFGDCYYMVIVTYFFYTVYSCSKHLSYMEHVYDTRVKSQLWSLNRILKSEEVKNCLTRT
eukprot:UN21587